MSKFTQFSKFILLSIRRKTNQKNEYLKFSTLAIEDSKIVQKRIIDLFKQAKDKYRDIFDIGDIIDLDSESIKYVVGQLQNYSLIKSQRDVIADAFETFIGYTFNPEPSKLGKKIVNML